MTLKAKIALWNTGLISVIVFILLLFMNSISDSVVDTSSKNQLKYVLEENADEVEWENGKLELDDIDFYENHVTTLVYSDKGFLLGGTSELQEKFEEYPLKHGEYTVVSLSNVNYILYDLLVESRKHEDIFLRGIVSVTEMSETVNLLFLLTFVTLPFFILLAGLGSYVIAQKSLKPISKIIQTAQDISHGDDLSQRISLGKGKDEIHQLGETFDVMFSRLEQAFLTEKQFTSDVSHELRTPVSVILAECDCNLDGDTDIVEKIKALESIQRQGKKMQMLITALLNFSRIDSGVMKLHQEPVDFSELVLIVCEEQKCLLLEGQDLQVLAEENITHDLDYGMMIRVLSNLIDNGFHYGKENSWVKVTLQQNERSVILSVEDNGIGIGADDIQKIFHRFYQVDSSRNKDKGNNMGLGLSMVEQIVRLHQGSITVDSILGEGTCFTITLPKKIS